MCQICNLFFLASEMHILMIEFKKKKQITDELIEIQV